MTPVPAEVVREMGADMCIAVNAVPRLRKGVQTVLSTWYRRFKRLESESQDGSFGARPDLVIVDGGKGQLHAAIDALTEAGRTDIPIVSLAKRLEEIYSRERFA